jgi:adenine deaminase
MTQARSPASVPVPSPSQADLHLLARRIRVALGQEPADLVLEGGKVVNVFTLQVEPANVAIADGWIAALGPHHWPARQSVALAGRTIMPGLIDSHMHLESTLLAPSELARLIVPYGTTATISDSHEVGNVLGTAGIDILIAASDDLPMDLFFMASSCVPATCWEDAGAAIGPADVRALLDRPRVLGLAEMMDMPAVLRADPYVLEKILAAHQLDRAIDGHAAGLAGLDLIAYVASGIRSDHESTTSGEARARAELGMLVQVREGSSARNLDAILPLLVSGALGDEWCLVTDDIFPDDLRDRGHMDGLLRRLVAGGVLPAVAVRHASLVPARHYGLTDRGAVTPGYRADLVVVDDLAAFRPHLVLKKGQVVAQDGRCLAPTSSPRLPLDNTVHIAPLDESAFRLALAGAACPVIVAIPGQIVTRREVMEVALEGGYWAFDPNQDVALIASIERHRATGRIGLGLVSGFSLNKGGALGSSVAHDSHNLIVAGTNPRDMLICVRALAEMGGGFIVVSGGQVRAQMPLPFAGLLSVESADVVCRQLDEIRQAAHSLGCTLPAPFGTLSFLALPVIPELRITDQGLYDVTAQQFLRL